MSENKDWTGNRKSVWTTNGCTNHSINEREKNDFYASDPTTLDKLEKKFKIPHYVYECACGMGHLSEHLKEQGHDVYSSDLIDRGYGVTGVNFLEQLTMPEVLPTQDVCILTNPPYSLVTEFILHALDILPMDAHAIFLLKTTSIEGKKRFEQIYRNTPPITSFSSSKGSSAQKVEISRGQRRRLAQVHRLTAGWYSRKDIKARQY